MAFKTVQNLDADTSVQLGGKDASGKANPTEIEGYYLGFREIDGDFGLSKLHVFQTEEGNVGVWGKTRLNSKLSPSLVGTMVKVTFTGMIAPRKKGRKPSFGYEVQFDNENVIDVSTLSQASDSEASDSEASDEEYGNNGEDLPEESDPGEAQRAPDEVPPARAAAPRQAAQAASPAAQQKVKDLLAGRRRQAQ